MTKKLKSQITNNESDDEESKVVTAASSDPITKLGQNLNIKLQPSESKNPWISFIPVVSNEIIDENKTTLNSEEIYVKPKAFVDKDEIVRAQSIQNIENDSDDESDDDIILDNDNSQLVNGDNNENEEDSDVEIVPDEETKSKPAAIPDLLKELPPTKSINKEIDINQVLIAEEEEEGNDEDRDKTEVHRLTLSEAFADDDVVAEFRLEKVS